MCVESKIIIIKLHEPWPDVVSIGLHASVHAYDVHKRIVHLGDAVHF